MNQLLHNLLLQMCCIEERCVELRKLGCKGNFLAGHTTKETITMDEAVEIARTIDKLNVNVRAINMAMALLTDSIHNPL